MVIAREIDAERLETAHPFIIMPRADKPILQIVYLGAGKLQASSPPESEGAIFANGLQRSGKIGIGILSVNRRGTTIMAHLSMVGKPDSVDALVTGLQEIRQTVELIHGTWSTAMMVEYPEAAKVKQSIYSGSKTVLRLLRRLRQLPRQEFVGSALRFLDAIKCNKRPPAGFR